MPGRPKIFVSYARADGEAAADHLCARLEAEAPDLEFWRDRYEMEGGKDWWNQITRSLDEVEFVVLVMTPAALESTACRAEWRYARAQGVCVYPVKGAPDAELGIEALPRWMSRQHFYDPKKEWDTFVAHLRAPCQQERVPFSAPELPRGHVGRPALRSALLDAVRDAGENPIPGLTVLHGAGGFGKTTIATALCHTDDVLTTFSNGVLWVTLGEEPDVRGGLTKLYAALTGTRPGFVDIEDATTALRERLKDKNCLVVIDDAWNEVDLRPFLDAAKGLSCVVTTRIKELAVDADRVLSVREMTTDEAVSMLCARLELGPGHLEPIRELARRLGEWPLLLRLASATLRQRIQRGDSLDGALEYLDHALTRRGFTAFDHRDPRERNQAVARTMGVSLEHLDDPTTRLYFELSHFPPDIDVPLNAIGVLWGLERLDTEELIDRLADLSLLELDLQARSIRLHDVIRAFLADRMKDSGHDAEATFRVRAVLADETLRHEQRKPRRVFELAREGRLRAAEQALAVLEPDPPWDSVALLTSAWLATESAETEALALRDRVAAMPITAETAPLLERLASLPNGAATPASDLPPPPDEFMINMILERLGGGGVTGVEPLSLEGLGDEGPAFLAEQDGPLLVAFAALDPANNTAPLQRYISMLGSNEYAYYRNRSLSLLLHPVLSMPDPQWVRARLVDLVTAALSSEGVQFREGVRIAALARRSGPGDPGPAGELRQLRERTMDEAAELAPERGKGDPWGHYLRRLGALAEAHWAMGAPDEAGALLDRALTIPYGFAGFRTQACLALAEAARVVDATDGGRVTAALDAALRAAHNIQDPTFCALSTARVHAMRERWWGEAFDVKAVTLRLEQDPNRPEFCPTHVVGELYDLRDRGPMKLPSPAEVGPTHTLAHLASLLRCPVDAVVRLNAAQGWEPDTVLPDGARVNLPDPAFAPMLAARFAAQALATLPPPEATDVLRHLLRLTEGDATATDTVATRLLLAVPDLTTDEWERVLGATDVQSSWIDAQRPAPGHPRPGDEHTTMA
ncbi:MAG: TIR domain-containing protein [Gemmatimonadota bacterium]